jgi:periplasmic copper chaperone A
MLSLYCKARSGQQAGRSFYSRCGRLALSLLAATFVAGCSESEKSIELTNAWVRAVPPVSSTTAAYLTLTNNTEAAVVFTGAQAEFATEVELHDMSMNADGMRSMKHIESLPLAPGESVSLAPGGIHVMLFGLTEVPAEGETVSVCLRFAEAPPLCEMFPVLREAP